ncbi:uncharacterized protein TRIADDRAFT_56342 [Trichoplax adhaerens]|uniref:Uncharacterized protein n=1 Tax=Trichoplax adhaerens TaxID=10228 RepID=B3RXV3_TRIAD|nr:predicted protein [Trichoplax adhaerens]EDV24495.1 predicted protein [Trichoplax adhaerens]|eukprot:XP_002112385.1 predicted protein [Trichoplax adhaerens]
MAIDWNRPSNASARFRRSPLLIVNESPTIQKAKQRNIQEEISLYQRLKTIQMDEKYCINKININKRLTEYKFRATVTMSSDLQPHHQTSFQDTNHQRKSKFRQQQYQSMPPPSPNEFTQSALTQNIFRSHSKYGAEWFNDNLAKVVSKWRIDNHYDRYNPPFEETYAYINTMPHARPPSSLASYWISKKQRSKKQALINYEYNQRLLEREMRTVKSTSP